MARKLGSGSVTYKECKTYGHAWDEYEAGGEWQMTSFDRLTLRCTRCMTTRHDYFDARGDVEKRYYAYPEGYKWASKDVMLSRAALRLLLHR